MFRKETFLKNVFSIFLIFPFFISLDFLITKIHGVRGFSQFFEEDENVGYINKRNFKARFGGPLDEFTNVVTLNKYGVRESSPSPCTNKINGIIIGDSVVAGFEVNDNETYVSIINKKCIKELLFINGGVRAHDTHMSMANIKRLIKEYGLKEEELKIIYILSVNDFYENDDKFRYSSLKSKFGSVYDGDFFKPYRNPFINRLRIFIGDNFYFLTRSILLLEEFKRIRNEKIFANIQDNNLSNQSNDFRCKRAISIVNKYFLEKSKINNIFIGFSPMFLNPQALDESVNYEKCLRRNSLDSKKITVIPFSEEIKSLIPKGKDPSYLTFKRDFHLNLQGHRLASKALEKIIMEQILFD